MTLSASQTAIWNPKQPEGLTRSSWWWRGPWTSGLYSPIQTTHYCLLLDASELCPTYLSVHWTALEGILGATRCCLLTGESEPWKMKTVLWYVARRREGQKVSYPSPIRWINLYKNYCCAKKIWTSESGHSMRDWWGSRGHVVRSEQSW